MPSPSRSVFGPLLVSWELSMRARNLSPRTITNYTEAVRQLDSALPAELADVTNVTPEHIREFIADLSSRRAAKTALSRYNALRIFFDWLVEEDELNSSPAARVRRPVAPEQPVAVPSDDTLRAILSTCGGKDFVSRRDNAGGVPAPGVHPSPSARRGCRAVRGSPRPVPAVGSPLMTCPAGEHRIGAGT